MTAIYADHSLFTVSFDVQKGCEHSRVPGGEVRGPRDQSFDLAVIEFDDDGQFEVEEQAQLRRAAEWITARRQGNFIQDGVVVVVFVHGWHHGARWEDTHFVAFRKVLRALAVREMERPRSRRVVGVYVAWHGNPPGYRFSHTPLLTNIWFYDRYRTAERISKGEPLYETLRTITSRTKESPGGLIPSQLILVGHSMGGLIVESALERLIKGHDLLQVGQAGGPWPVITHIAGTPVVFPDAVLSLNSAAASSIWLEIGRLLEEKDVRKRAESPTVSYAPPLVISATSTADLATRVLWRVTRPLERTTGHDHSLLTHDFQGEDGTVEAKPYPGPDFGQNYHVLRRPEPDHSMTPRMCVDLPVEDRRGKDHFPPHRRYRLTPHGPADRALPMWNFQLPRRLVKDHNDIFNPRVSSLLLAMMQISGTVGSLAPDWERSFEPYETNEASSSPVRTA